MSAATDDATAAATDSTSSPSKEAAAAAPSTISTTRLLDAHSTALTACSLEMTCCLPPTARNEIQVEADCLSLLSADS